jgi:hypothetical protein
MPLIKIAVESDDEWEEIGELEVDVVPRVGEVLALDEPEAGTKQPAGDFEVVSVKHYHYWRYPEKSEILVFLRSPFPAA